MRWYYLAIAIAAALVILSPRLVGADGPCVPVVREVPADSDAWRYSGVARGVGRDLGVPDDLLVRVVHVESRGDPEAVSSAGALGLMQQLRRYWFRGEDWTDPYQNVRKGAGMLRSLFEEFGDWLVATRWYGGYRGYEWHVWECQGTGSD